ncbi:T9SS type A sorting domain-containing protein, partial [Aureispira]|nr:T9SS type A sorting domain-containing protein [Aureispira sp.]
TTTFDTRVNPLPRIGFINWPDSLCLNADTFQLGMVDTVIYGTQGQFDSLMFLAINQPTYTIYDTSGTDITSTPPLFLDISNANIVGNNASAFDSLFISAKHTTDFSLGSCTSIINDSVRLDSVPIVYFQSLDSVYCENDSASIFLAFPPYYVGSGYMQFIVAPNDTTTIDSSFFWITPATMVNTSTPIPTEVSYAAYYTYKDTRGCRDEVFDTFDVRPYPRITFELPPLYDSTFCRAPGDTFDLYDNIDSPEGGKFTDNLALSSIKQDTLLDLGSIAGPRIVTYNYTDSATTCSNYDKMNLFLYNGAAPGFDIFGGCSNMDISFDPFATTLVSGIDSITSIYWDFGDSAPPLYEYTSTDSNAITMSDTTHDYSSDGIFMVTLFVENQTECLDSVSGQLIVSPSEVLDYEEHFDTGPAGWYNDQPITTTPDSIWQWTASLDNDTINDPGNAAWVTLPDTIYGKGQDAWVYSPCFDFTSALRPMIVFDLWTHVLEDIDGLVLEYYEPATNSWNVLGTQNKGVNWYESNFVLSRPGAQDSVTYPLGWTGQKTGFERVRYRLDQFKGQDKVRFRIAFASSPQTVITNLEGAAFDNVYVVERTRNVLVEHFDNENYVTPGSLSSDVVDQSVYDKIFNSSYGLDVFLLQYQTGIQNIGDIDSVNYRNQADPASRVIFYGLSDNNRILIDGMSIGTGVSQDLSEYNMDYDMLQFPDFDITINTPVLSGNALSVTYSVEALVNKGAAEYAVHTVVIQDSFTYNSGGFNMLSIMRKMLPNAAGQRYNQSWNTNDFFTATENWDYSGEIGFSSFNSNQLEVIVFIQNMDTKEVYQVQTTQDLTKYTVPVEELEGELSMEIIDLKVYPNPSSDQFTVEFDKELQGAYDWRLVDITGRIFQTGIAQRGTKSFIINADRLVSGTYFFVINSEKVYTHRKLVVIK